MKVLTAEEEAVNLIKALKTMLQASVKGLQVSQLKLSSDRVLVDSGSNSILRPESLTDVIKEVKVTLANDATVSMNQDTRTQSIVTSQGVQPIIPAIALYEYLGYLPRKVEGELRLMKGDDASGIQLFTDRGTTEIEYSSGMKLIWELEGSLIRAREGLEEPRFSMQALGTEERVIAEQLLQFITKAAKNPQEVEEKVEPKTVDSSATAEAEKESEAAETSRTQESVPEEGKDTAAGESAVDKFEKALRASIPEDATGIAMSQLRTVRDIESSFKSEVVAVRRKVRKSSAGKDEVRAFYRTFAHTMQSRGSGPSVGATCQRRKMPSRTIPAFSMTRAEARFSTSQ